MSGRDPAKIWEDSLDEGERRLARHWTGLAATGFGGGVDVFFSVLVLAAVSGGLREVMPEQTAHVLASLTFGVGFAFITLGRAELFTENFLVPVGTVWAGRGRIGPLLRMWVLTMLFNFAGLALFAAIFSVSGVVKPQTLDAAGTMADTLAQRSTLAAFMSAIGAGTIMTLFTWVVAAAETAGARVAASLVIGFVLAVPSLNHAIVGFGELSFGLIAGTSQADLGDLCRIVGLAIAGNMIGGVGLVFTTRLAQVRAEPNSASGRREEAREDPAR